MKLAINAPMSHIEIWQPRWKDRVVLIARFKVKEHNAIVFTKTPTMPDVYYLSGEKTRTFPVESNGKIDCYAVPLNDLEQLELE